MPKYVNRVPTLKLHKPSGRARVAFEGRSIDFGKRGTPPAACFG